MSHTETRLKGGAGGEVASATSSHGSKTIKRRCERRGGHHELSTCGRVSVPKDKRKDVPDPPIPTDPKFKKKKKKKKVGEQENEVKERQKRENKKRKIMTMETRIHDDHIPKS